MFRFGAIVAGGLALSACAGPLSALQPEGPAARGIGTLWWVMLAAGTGIFLVVASVLMLAFVRPAWLRRFGEARLILWGGLVVPLVILSGLVTAALALGERVLVVGRGEALRIEAVARQWTWRFRYPGGHETDDLLHLPAGRDVDIVLTSEDVIHGFWVPRLGGKLDAIPGHVNVIRLRADRPGTYGGVCAEYCGIGHAPMRFSVEAHEPDAFARIVGPSDDTRQDTAPDGEGGQ